MDYKERMEQSRRKRNTIFFGILLTIMSIVITLVIMTALYVLMAFVFIKLLGVRNANIIAVMTLIVFVGSIVIEFLIYRPLTKFLIIKFHLQDKLTKKSTDIFLYNKTPEKKHY